MLNFQIGNQYNKIDIISVNEDIISKYPNINYSFKITDLGNTIELNNDEELIKFELVEGDIFKCIFDSMAFIKEIELNID